jgi:hypothetical protein
MARWKNGQMIKTWEDKQAERRFAWGNLAAQVRSKNLRDDIRELRAKLSNSGLSSREIEEKVQKFISEQERPGLYIG